MARGAGKIISDRDKIACQREDNCRRQRQRPNNEDLEDHLIYLDAARSTAMLPMSSARAFKSFVASTSDPAVASVCFSTGIAAVLFAVPTPAVSDSRA